MSTEVGSGWPPKDQHAWATGLGGRGSLLAWVCAGHRAPGTQGDQGSNPGSTARWLVDVGVFLSAPGCRHL